VLAGIAGPASWVYRLADGMVPSRRVSSPMVNVALVG